MVTRGHRLVCGLSAVLIALAAALVAVRSADAHPIHTTIAQLTYDARGRSLNVMVRVFADDFAAAVGRHSRVTPQADHSVPPGAAFAYTRSAFSLFDQVGRPVTLEWCGARRSGDVVWLCLRAPYQTAPQGLRVLSALLFEVHDDQVNIVQSTVGGKGTSTLFTRGDRAKAVTSDVGPELHRQRLQPRHALYRGGMGREQLADALRAERGSGLTFAHGAEVRGRYSRAATEQGAA